jgi:hypothetical protein
MGYTGTQDMNQARRHEQFQALQQDYRRQLETFYAYLKLAPPYHSIEKAIQQLAPLFSQKPPADQESLFEDPVMKWSLYQQAFIDSGLRNKHRGIILGLIQAQDPATLPEEHRYFLKAFLS